TEALEGRGFNDAELFLQILADLVQLFLLDRQRTGVTLHAITGEYLDVDNGTLGAGGHAQGGVLDVGGLLTKDRSQQLLFRCQLGFALGRDLADQNVAGANFGAHVDDTRLVQLAQRGFTDVGDIGGDFLWPQLGVTGYAGQFLDVDSSETVFLHHPLGHQDGVFEVVTVPRHEGHTHVLTQGQFTHIDRRAVGQDVLAGYHVTFFHQRTLVNAGVLVGTGVLGQGVDIHTGLARLHFVIVDADNDTAGIDRVDHTTTAGGNADTGVPGHVALHPGTHQRLLGTQGRNRLALHVRTHEGTVGIVMLEERDQRGSNRYNLARRHVHQGDFFRRLDAEFVHVTHSHQLFHQLAITHFGTGLGDDMVGFFDGGQEHDLVGDDGVLDAAVRAFQEAILVGPRIGRQGVDQADVRTFRRFDRAHATVGSRVHAAHFETGTLAGQTARPKPGDAALVGDLGQRVVLVHELGQLAGTEEFLHRRRNRLGVDQILRHQAFAFGHGQTFFHRALDPDQTDAELVLGHLADGADATVTQVVDIVHHALAVTDINQGLENLDDVFLAQHARTFDLFTTDAAVELHTANGRQIVTIAAEEQVVEQGLGSILGRRLARTHHAIDFHQGLELAGGIVDAQGVGDERTTVDIVGVQRFDMIDLGLDQLVDKVSGHFDVALNQNLAGSRVHHSLGDGTANQVVVGDFQAGDTGLLQLVDM